MADRQLPRLRKPKKIRLPKDLKGKGCSVHQMLNGKFQSYCLDSHGKRDRKYKDTAEEAFDHLRSIVAAKLKGGYRATAASRTFDEALDLYLKRQKREGHQKSSIERNESNVRILSSMFGKRKLSEFVTDRMQFVQKWFDHSSLHSQSLAHFKSTINIALEEAIDNEYMAAPNPTPKLRIPKTAKKREERDVLKPEEISKLVRESFSRSDKEHVSVWRRAARGLGTPRSDDALSVRQ